MHFNIRATLRVLIFLQVLGSSSLLWSTTNVLGERLTVIENISDCKRVAMLKLIAKFALRIISKPLSQQTLSKKMRLAK